MNPIEIKPITVAWLFPILLLYTGFTGNTGLCQTVSHVPSDQRGDIKYRAFSNIDGNNIRTSIFNSGYSGAPREEPESINYEWPKNTDRIYISIVGIWIGGEVTNESGENTEIVDVFAWRTSPGST